MKLAQTIIFNSTNRATVKSVMMCLGTRTSFIFYTFTPHIFLISVVLSKGSILNPSNDNALIRFLVLNKVLVAVSTNGTFNGYSSISYIPYLS